VVVLVAVTVADTGSGVSLLLYVSTDVVDGVVEDFTFLVGAALGEAEVL
jgi:hypothetical protein